MTNPLLEDQIKQVFDRQIACLDQDTDEPILGVQSITVRRDSEPRNSRWALVASVAASAIVVVGLLAFLSRPEAERIDTAAGPNSTSGQTNSSSVWFGDPNGDFYYVLRRIEAEVDGCMAQVGHPGWNPNVANSVNPSLPIVESVDDAVVGYEDAYAYRFSTDLSARPEGEAEALLGNGDPSDAVDLGNGLARDMGGCQGDGYRAVLDEGELVGFLEAEAVLLDLGNAYRTEALEETASISEWQSCMALAGFTLGSPFEIGFSTGQSNERDVASADAVCRESTDLDNTYAEALDALTADDYSDVHPQLGDQIEDAASLTAAVVGRLEAASVEILSTAVSVASLPPLELEADGGIWVSTVGVPANEAAQEFVTAAFAWINSDISVESAELGPTWVSVANRDESIRMLFAPTSARQWQLLQVGTGPDMTRVAISASTTAVTLGAIPEGTDRVIIIANGTEGTTKTTVSEPLAGAVVEISGSANVVLAFYFNSDGKLIDATGSHS